MATILLSYLHETQSFRFNHHFNSRSKLSASHKMTNQHHLHKQIRNYQTNNQVKIQLSIQHQTRLHPLRSVQIWPSNKFSSRNQKSNSNPVCRLMTKVPGSHLLGTISSFPRIISNLSYQKDHRLSFFLRNLSSLKAFYKELNRMNQNRTITPLSHR